MNAFSLFLATAVICFLILRSTFAPSLQKELHSWIGYQISFPESVQLISGDRSLLHKPYKIMMYIDDMGCTSCNLHLEELSDLYETLFNQAFPDNLSFVLLFDGREKEQIMLPVRNANWEMPVLWDKDGVISKRRPFPKHYKMRCMLLDAANRVVLVGNPFYYRNVCDLYLKFLLNQDTYLLTTKI